MTNQPSRWLPQHVAAIATEPVPHGPIISATDASPMLPGTDLWDMWPLQYRDGHHADIAGGTLWFVLSAPIVGGPDERHFLARIRMLFQYGGIWTDLGLALPAGFGPGNREWSGCAIIDDDGAVSLFFTAAGVHGEIGGYRQRLVRTVGRLNTSGPSPSVTGWSVPVECFAADAEHYRIVDQRDGAIGKIKAFRDPGYFRDPADGASYLLFTGSLAASTSQHDGCIGIARAVDERLAEWVTLPPLVSADALNNELERPHIICRDGRYYLFWSTQQSVFAPSGPAGPTGLYGMVAQSVLGPYMPINGTGLVLANPPAEPYQAFSWHVQADLSVTSFVDSWGMGGRMPQDETQARAHFGGTPAPSIRIALDGAASRVTGFPSSGAD